MKVNIVWDPEGKQIMRPSTSDASCKSGLTCPGQLYQNRVSTIKVEGPVNNDSSFSVSLVCEDVCACSVFVSDVTDSGKLQCWGFSYEELEKAQEQDNSLKILRDWLKDGLEPDEGQLFIANPEVTFFWINKECFRLVDGVVFKSKEGSGDMELVIPDSLKTAVIELQHDISSSGHQGVARTKAKV
ncbi:hypothetical protein DPMN_100258 [Dreissena polymorpha]|uniref:Uncharacterized protein n=1 Tax=Dreissena polymorpha TaxID=45954 RepID=A0A9D4LFG4_DREPO|nr:hypothetical protein DPMN_100258 [Dreissena polymorpha]